MMVKVIGKDGWALIDNVSKVEQVSTEGGYQITGCDDFTYDGHGDIVNLHLTLGNGTMKQVLAFSPVYILNDQGKTVERI